MSHPRQLIRDQIFAILDNYAGLSSVNVYNSRMISIRDDKLPAVSVRYSETQDGEEVTTEEDRPDDYNYSQRELSISIDVITQNSDDKAASDQNDDICNEVEDAMAKNINYPDKWENAELYRVRFRSDVDGEKAIRSAENLYRLNYKTLKAGA